MNSHCTLGVPNPQPARFWHTNHKPSDLRSAEIAAGNDTSTSSAKSIAGRPQVLCPLALRFRCFTLIIERRRGQSIRGSHSALEAMFARGGSMVPKPTSATVGWRRRLPNRELQIPHAVAAVTKVVVLNRRNGTGGNGGNRDRNLSVPSRSNCVSNKQRSPAREGCAEKCCDRANDASD